MRPVRGFCRAWPVREPRRVRDVGTNIVMFFTRLVSWHKLARLLLLVGSSMLRRRAACCLLVIAVAASLTGSGDKGSSAAAPLTRLDASADIALQDEDAPDPVQLGADLVYELTVTNAGPDDADAVVLTDRLPDSVTLTSAASDRGGCTEQQGVVSCDLDILAAAASATVTLHVTPEQSGVIADDASVTGETPDPDTSNNAASARTSVGRPPNADVALDIDDTPDPVQVGNDLAYTLNVTNLGPETAESVVLRDALPDAASFVSATSANGSCVEHTGVVNCELGDLFAFASIVVTIHVVPTQAGVITSDASLTTDTADPDPSNNSANAQTSVEVPPSADLVLQDVDTPDPALVGDDLVYTLTITNDGPDAAAEVLVRDTLPAAVTFSSATADDGACTNDDGVVSCALDRVRAHAVASVSIHAKPLEPGTISDDASVTSRTSDPDFNNNAAKARTVVRARKPNIVVVITDDQPALDGRLINFEPTVRTIFKDHGTTFTDFHGESPLCCPGRAGFLSGQHTTNHHVVINAAKLFNPSMTLATQLDGVGYYTFLAGKYMNGYDAKNCLKANRLNCAPRVPPGWDRWAALGGVFYYDYDLWVDGATAAVHHGSSAADYSTDVIAQYAVQMIHDAPPTAPIFGWIAPVGPHGPSTPPPRYLTTPCRPAAWGPPSYQEADVGDKPAWVQAIPRGNPTPKPLQGACRALLADDDLVRDVRDALAADGRLDNTLFIYTGDNGMNEGEHRLGGKTAPYETQLPFLASWPRQLGTSSRSITERLENIDLAPTLCELAGCTLGPYPNGQPTPDGYSFAQLLLGNETSVDRSEVLEDMPGGVTTGSGPWFSVITTRHSPLASVGCAAASSNGCLWQYTQYPTTNEDELYDLSNGPCWTWSLGQAGDPCELENLTRRAAYAQIKATLANDLARLKLEKGHP
jgi:uncharacterized repeat protein (TIGR01451 family)